MSEGTLREQKRAKIGDALAPILMLEAVPPRGRCGMDIVVISCNVTSERGGGCLVAMKGKKRRFQGRQVECMLPSVGIYTLCKLSGPSLLLLLTIYSLAGAGFDAVTTDDMTNTDVKKSEAAGSAVPRL